MKPGLLQPDSYKYMQEMLPLVKKLWAGDVTHDGEYWQFPSATSCPKPVQSEVPIWVAARSPITFDYAVANDANIMCWPLTLPFSEADKYREQLDDAIAKAGGSYNRMFALMRHSAVYETSEDRQRALDAIRSVLGRFGNLMMRQGEVVNGFPEQIPLDQLEGNWRVDPAMLEENLMFGTPEEVVAKLRRYEGIGVDSFIYYASMGLGIEAQKRSFQLFIDKVTPEFA